MVRILCVVLGGVGLGLFGVLLVLLRWSPAFVVIVFAVFGLVVRAIQRHGPWANRRNGDTELWRSPTRYS